MQVVERQERLIREGRILGQSPFDGSDLEPVPALAHDQIQRTVARAREAQAKWSEHTPHERARRVKKLRKGYMELLEPLAKILANELGKSEVEAYSGELIASADLFPYWARQAPKLLLPEAKGLNPINFMRKTGVTELVPRGVIGLITPWNYPVSIALRTLVPALAAGNAVVIKPSEFAPRVTALLCELFEELGVPGLVGVVQGCGDAGQRLIEAGVNHVVFTGSVATGRKVAQRCADLLLGYSLELGGKDAALVLGDCDLDRTVEGVVWGAFANAGQNCSAIERVYVVEPLARRFIDKVVRRTEQLVVGNASVGVYDVGPVVRAQGLENIKTQVQDAIQHGATLRVGGKATGFGLHFEPTVLTDVDDDMAVMTDETFGPVLPIAVVRDEEEAVARANRSVYGLTASIWTRDIERGRRLAQRLKTGIVTINNHSFTAVLPHAPWHGRGHSGGGVTNSRFAFYDLVEPRYLLMDRLRSKELWWFPHNEVMGRMVRAMATLFGKGGHRLKALLTLLACFPKRWR